MRRARVILTTYNQLPLLRRAIRGYLRQTTTDFALTVADDGSRADTRDWLREFSAEAAEKGIPFLHVWQKDEGFRRAAALNEGVRHSESEPLLIFSDGDCVPPARFVESHLAAHEPMSFHVAGAYRLSQEVTEGLTDAMIDSGAFEGLGSEKDRRALRRRWRKSFWGTLVRRRNRPKILGLNLAIDRALFVALNGFDERFRKWGLEDSDLRDRAMRLRPRPPVKNLYTKNDVYHLWHASSGDPKRRDQWEYYRTPRPVRCEEGLARDGATRGTFEPAIRTEG